MKLKKMSLFRAQIVSHETFLSNYVRMEISQKVLYSESGAVKRATTHYSFLMPEMLRRNKTTY